MLSVMSADGHFKADSEILHMKSFQMRSFIDTFLVDLLTRSRLSLDSRETSCSSSKMRLAVNRRFV